MKNSRWILTIWLAASAWAQTAATKTQAVSQIPAKPAAVLAKQDAAHVVPVAARPNIPTAAAAKATPQKTSARTSAKAYAGKPKVSATDALATKKTAASRPGRKGQRDPFVSPIADRARSGPPCTGTGKRCLYVGDLRLLGIVQSEEGVIAVVGSGSRTYFLREHDPLADGDVEKITGDAITIRQRSSDLLGRPVVREVIRKLGGPAV